MGTSGVYGFRKNGEDKLTYNHFDSYPECLGESIVGFLKEEEVTIKYLNTLFDRIYLVSEDKEPTEEEIKKFKGWADTGVSTGKLTEWYVLLRGTQGNFDYFKTVDKDEKLPFIESKNFIKDSLFCEWGYIINLDTNKLEIWRGFQDKPNSPGNRYGFKTVEELDKFDPDRSSDYYACEKIIEFPIKDIPENWFDQICDIVNNEEEEE